MTPGRAREIVERINARAFFHMRIVEAKDVLPLDGVTLAEMIEAAGLVEKENESAKYIDGKKSITVVPADRLIAAVFTLENYQADSEGIALTPIRNRVFADGATVKAIAVIETGPEDPDAEED